MRKHGAGGRYADGLESRIDGGCHCGAVKFEFTPPATLEVLSCNCSICQRSSFLHLIVPARHFHLHRGQDALSEYRFNSRVARHLFCRHCGVKSFYVPRSNPDGYSINLNCLPAAIRARARISGFDGRNWEAHGALLGRLTSAGY